MEDAAALLLIRAVPNAKRSEVAGADPDGTIRIRLAAPAVDGKANAALREFLRKALGVPKSAVAIVRGEKARQKQVRIEGVAEFEALERLGL